MKNLIIGMFLFGFIATGNSQILLEETKIEYQPVSLALDQESHQRSIELPEKLSGEFQQNPLAFMKTRFNVQKFLKDNEEADYDAFEVFFKSKKGFLKASFNKTGDLISSNQKFKNIPLPQDVRLEVFRLHRDAMIEGIKYTAFSKGWDITKEIYRIKIKDGDKTRRVRINRNNDQLSLAGF
ncbi:hypothetical protein V5739_15335 [Salinimicrobium sp. TIG7-5_MAKvit]|uniref:hypothetical protein n=1 Tax=Salinimicrobium sp. TIG7-5_MAKvit TaxID=3121289 RepID=UPI003C6E24C7